MMNKNSKISYPQTPAPLRNGSFLMSAAGILETPTLMNKPTSSVSEKSSPYSANFNNCQLPSAASTTAMQFLMFNQMQASCSGTPFRQNIHGRTNLGNTATGLNFSIPSNTHSTTTTVSTNIVENFQLSNNQNSYKRKQEDSLQRKPLKRVAFEPLPLKSNTNRNPQRVLSAICPAKQPNKPTDGSGKPDPKKFRIITGSLEYITKLTKSDTEGSPLVEVFANILSIKSGTYECEKILLLRNKSGPVMLGVFYEIDFRMIAVGVGDLVRCVGRLTGGSRLQILKITPANAEDERMAQRLQTVCGFTATIKR
ncbi:uncharacterized protein LOC131425876 [Malaya genurostris]|uniref:uncharacterized protein LOC131425876 n=1 Tax=Malaya genurostris TaxID=325434 RepID=UPI0026F40609|nr:uncharacterized protein LOC131425876 [Malaya genurostris]